ncbi:MAG: DUF192 domain-containing protein [Cyanobacteria bacterium P01_D01_bin.128]
MLPSYFLMHISRPTLWLGLSLLLMGTSCSSPAVSPEADSDRSQAETAVQTESLQTESPQAESPQAESPSAVPILTEELAALAQSLPITAQAQIGSELIQLEVATTRQEQSLGLMFRDELADDRGMLFPFETPRPVQFWMKNVFIDLDMIFLRDGVVQAIASDVPPCVADPCPTYGPRDVVIDQVIELRGGRADELGVSQGDVITVVPVE